VTLKALSSRAIIAVGAAVLLAACSSSSGTASSAPAKPVTADSARVDLVTAKIAGACAQEEYVTCQTMDGSGKFAVMVMSEADIQATFTRLCKALAGQGSDPDPATLGNMKLVTDKKSFLVVGGVGLTMPTSVDPAAIQKVLGGEVVSMADICAA
jgi:uncharacterized lipoprotein YajG